MLVRYPITTAASQQSTNAIPGGAIVTRRWIEITTPYSAGATITLGQTGSTSLLLGTTDVDPVSAIVSGNGNEMEADEEVAWGSTSLPLLTTVGGAPAAGAGFAAAEYYLPVS